jgi:hypothetical protein
MKLADFQRYYNGHRAHAGLDGSALRPDSRFAERRGIAALASRVLTRGSPPRAGFVGDIASTRA